MIRVILKGGLGNQMFQYAAGKSLAKKLNTKVLLDTSFLDNMIPIPGFTRRKFRLDDFGIKDEKTSKLKNKILNRYFSYPICKLTYPFIKNKYVQEDPYEFTETFYELKDNAVIDGYFNNINFFKGIEHEVVDYFNIESFKKDETKEIEQKIKSTDYESVALHIRQGDYKNQKHIDVFTQLDGDYYNKAIELVKEKVTNTYFFIFAFGVEDGFIENNINLTDKEYTIVSFNDKSDLRLMSLCKHNIIANSSYSFWGAFLNKNPNKLVISPIKWTKIWQDFNVPKGWIGL